MLPYIADISGVMGLAVISYMLRVFLFLSIDIPDVEPMNSPLCNNLVKALVLEGQRSRETYAVGPASLDSPSPHPFFRLSTAV